MAEPTLKIASAGYDVTTADPKNLTIDSTRNQFKVMYSGQETFSLNAGNGYSYIKTITHNFGYKPQALCWAYYPAANEDYTAMVMVPRFTLIPYGYAIGTDPATASTVASIERSTTYVKFKFFQQTDWAEPAPANFTLTNMKMKYLVFIDAE